MRELINLRSEEPNSVLLLEESIVIADIRDLHLLPNPPLRP